jgi:putative ABC transport system permease protein
MMEKSSPERINEEALMNSYILKLAFKNITRSKRRTILTFLMLSFGVSIYILMAGLFDGFDRTSFKNAIEFETGHFKIQLENFDKDRPFDKDFIITNMDKVESVLKTKKFIKGYTGRLQILGEIDNSQDTSPVIAVGLDPSRDKTVFNLKQYIYEGGFAKNGVVVGKKLAEDMNLKMGDVIYITFRNKDDMVTSMQLSISGLLNCSDEKVNMGTVFINLDEAMKAMNFRGVTEFAVLTDATTEDLNQVKKYIRELQKELPGFKMDRWDQQNEGLQAAVAIKKKAFDILLLFILAIGAVGIVNTMLISILEKRREIGTLKALGMQDKEARNLFVFEGLVIGLIGSIIGAILGTFMNLYFVVKGIDYAALAGREYAFLGVIKSTWPIAAYFISMFLATSLSVLASYYPAKKVMKMQPVDCLRTIQ